MAHLLIRVFLVTCFACILIQPMVKSSTDAGGSDIEQTSTTQPQETTTSPEDTIASIPYATDDLTITVADHSNLNFQDTSTKTTLLPITTLPLSLNSDISKSPQSDETLTPRATTELPLTSNPSTTTSQVNPETNADTPTKPLSQTESTTIPATTQPSSITPGLTFTTTGLCYETTATEPPCPAVNLGKKELRELYNSRVVKAERYRRPKDFCLWRASGIKLHCGVVVTLEKPYKGVSRWLIHKGKGYGNASEAVVRDARCMSPLWSRTQEKNITKSTVGDYVKAAGPNYNLFCDNCIDACDRMMELN